MVLAEVGGVGQERLRAHAAVAHGELSALYLAGIGVGRLTVPAETIAMAVRELNPLVVVQVDPTLARFDDAGDARLNVEEALAVVKEALEL